MSKKKPRCDKASFNTAANPPPAAQMLPALPLPGDIFDSISDGNIGPMEEGLQRGMSINAVDDRGWTALMWAAATGRPEVTRWLLDRGADIDHRAESDGFTALHAAIDAADNDTMDQLLAKGARVDIPNNEDLTAIDTAEMMANEDLCRKLLAAQISRSLTLTSDAFSAPPMRLRRDGKPPVP